MCCIHLAMENKIQTHNYKVIHRETYEKVNKKAANVTKQALAQPPPTPKKGTARRAM